MIEIIEISEKIELMEEAINFFWKQWGNSKNYSFYKDSIVNSTDPNKDLSKFYLALQGEKIVGIYAILRNDLISRQDLVPWIGCLYVTPDARGHSLGSKLLEHAKEQAKSKGFEKLYLCTTLENYYEKYGWQYDGIGYYFNGEETKIYSINIQ
jgi:GNAT superfamily N-acetyltransferase